MSAGLRLTPLEHPILTSLWFPFDCGEIRSDVALRLGRPRRFGVDLVRAVGFGARRELRMGDGSGSCRFTLQGGTPQLLYINNLAETEVPILALQLRTPAGILSTQSGTRRPVDRPKNFRPATPVSPEDLQQLPTAVFIAQILIGSDQDFENCLEGVSAPEPCCVDGCSHISLGLGGPHCAVAVGDFPLDHAGPQFSL